MQFVTDTHAILWHFFTTPRRLGPAAQKAFVAADHGHAQIFIPSLVVAEMIAVIERGRLSGITMAALLKKIDSIKNSSNYQILPLRPDTVIASHTLTAIPDIFDRLIVAEALRLGVPLITRDKVITRSGIVTTVW